jgi:predicted  nucleic acid-binding Zn-ribbon protein
MNKEINRAREALVIIEPEMREVSNIGRIYTSKEKTYRERKKAEEKLIDFLKNGKACQQVFSYCYLVNTPTKSVHLKEALEEIRERRINLRKEAIELIATYYNN